MSPPLRSLASLACTLTLLAAACASPAPTTPTAAPTPTPAALSPAIAAPGSSPTAAPASTPRAAATPAPTPAQDASPYDIRSVLPRDAIPSIDAPEFLDAGAASEFMSDGHLVIGLSVGGEHRAYSTAFLSSHEIVNDTIGGAPVAVTW